MIVTKDLILAKFFVEFHHFLFEEGRRPYWSNLKCGICFNFKRYSLVSPIYCGDPSGILSKLFEANGLDVDYPFNSEEEEYVREHKLGILYSNPIRLEFIRAQAEPFIGLTDEEIRNKIKEMQNEYQS